MICQVEGRWEIAVDKAFELNIINDALDLISQLDRHQMATSLAESLSESLLSSSHKTGCHIFAAKVKIDSLDLKGQFKDLNAAIQNINSLVMEIGNTVTGNMIKKALEAVTKVFPFTQPAAVGKWLQRFVPRHAVDQLQTPEIVASPIVVSKTS